MGDTAPSAMSVANDAIAGAAARPAPAGATVYLKLICVALFWGGTFTPPGTTWCRYSASR